MTEPRYLLPGERPWVNVIRHWAVLLHPGLRAGPGFAVLFFLWLNAGSGTSAGILAVLMLGVAGWFGWHVAEWRHDRFVVTDKRVLLVTGLITKRVGMMPLKKVTDMTYERSWLGRRWGYGAFIMESAGQEQALHRVDYIPQPEEVSQTMFRLLFDEPAGAASPAEPDSHPEPGGGVVGQVEQPGQAAEYPTDPNLPQIDLEDFQPSNVRVLGPSKGEGGNPDPPRRS